MTSQDLQQLTERINTLLAVVLLVVLGSFVFYYLKTQKEIETFHLELEKSIQEQKQFENNLS